MSGEARRLRSAVSRVWKRSRLVRGQPGYVETEFKGTAMGTCFPLPLPGSLGFGGTREGVFKWQLLLGLIPEVYEVARDKPCGREEEKESPEPGQHESQRGAESGGPELGFP